MTYIYLAPFLVLRFVFLKLRVSLAGVNPAGVVVIVIVTERTGKGLVPMLPGLPGDHGVVYLHPVRPASYAVQALSRSVGHNELSLGSQLIPVSIWAEVIWHPIRKSEWSDLNDMFDLEQQEPHRGGVGEETQLAKLLRLTKTWVIKIR